MKRAHLVGFALILTTAVACGRVADSRLNPFNWFGGGRSVEVAPTLIDDPVFEFDRRPLMAQITDLRIARTPGGAVLTATGLPPVQGWYDAELVPENDELEPVNGVLSFSFRGRPPLETTRIGTARSRDVVAGAILSDAQLRDVREIRVVARANARAVRR